MGKKNGIILLEPVLLKKGQHCCTLLYIFNHFVSFWPFLIHAGCRTSSSSTDGAATTSQLILSGGEGYINFRIGETWHDYYITTYISIYFILPLRLFYEGEIRI